MRKQYFCSLTNKPLKEGQAVYVYLSSVYRKVRNSTAINNTFYTFPLKFVLDKDGIGNLVDEDIKYIELLEKIHNKPVKDLFTHDNLNIENNKHLRIMVIDSDIWELITSTRSGYRNRIEKLEHYYEEFYEPDYKKEPKTDQSFYNYIFDIDKIETDELLDDFIYKSSRLFPHYNPINEERFEIECSIFQYMLLPPNYEYDDLYKNYKLFFSELDNIKNHILKANIFYERTKLLNSLVSPFRYIETEKTYDDILLTWKNTKKIILELTKNLADEDE